MSAPFEITKLTKDNGPLSKYIRLGEDGQPISDGSACKMGSGKAERLKCASLHAFAEAIHAMRSDQAIALGSLRPDLADEVYVVTQTELNKNDFAGHGIIARTADYICYRPGQQGVGLIDVDTKGMPDFVKERIYEKGGYWNVLVEVLPALETCGRAVRSSTSSGLSNSETGEAIVGSQGQHIFPLLADVSDHERFLKVLHERCWLAGYGWFTFGNAGQLLERSLVDRMVYGPERLVFEGAPVSFELDQDRETRRPVVTDGPALDSRKLCPDLTPEERERLNALKADDRRRVEPAANEQRAKYLNVRVEELIKRTGISQEAAKQVVEAAFNGLLLPSQMLPWDREELAGSTVADVLADPDRFIGETLADPLEGVGYGRCKAMVLRGRDGSLYINSFAHGRTTYDLKYDAASIEAAIEKTGADILAKVFVELLSHAKLTPVELERLKNLVAKKSGCGKRALNDEIKQAKKEQVRAIEDDYVAEINKDNFVVNEAGKARVYSPRRDPILNRRCFYRSTFEDFTKLHMNRFVWVADEGGEVNRKPLGAAWLGHPERRQYTRGIVFDPSGKQEPGVMNLWEGFAVEPKQGDWLLLRSHIVNVICDGVTEHFNYLMGWMARLAQNPAEPGNVAVVMLGGEGTGKGTLARALLHIFGQHGLAISNSRHLTGNFNQHLRDCAFLFADEALFAGDRQHVGTLKSLITEPYLTIEGKGENLVQTPNFLHVMMASNEDWAIPASQDSRRFFVLRVSDSKKRDTAYFGAIWKQMEAGGYEAMLYDLMAYDLTDFNVWNVPETEALRDQRGRSLRGEAAWWRDVLDRGHIGSSAEWQEWMSSGTLYDSYCEHVKRRSERPVADHTLGTFLRPMAVKKCKQHGRRGWLFGSLVDARERFNKVTGLAVDWGDEGETASANADPGLDDLVS